MSLTKKELKLAIRRAKKRPIGINPESWDDGGKYTDCDDDLETADPQYLRQYGCPAIQVALRRYWKDTGNKKSLDDFVPYVWDAFNDLSMAVECAAEEEGDYIVYTDLLSENPKRAARLMKKIMRSLKNGAWTRP